VGVAIEVPVTPVTVNAVDSTRRWYAGRA